MTRLSWACPTSTAAGPYMYTVAMVTACDGTTFLKKGMSRRVINLIITIMSTSSLDCLAPVAASIGCSRGQQGCSLYGHWVRG